MRHFLYPADTANFVINGPRHRLFAELFPRRARAMIAGETVPDTEQGLLVHETNHLPQLYVPGADLRSDLL